MYKKSDKISYKKSDKLNKKSDKQAIGQEVGQ